MKANIHPNWKNETTVTCSCGNTFKTGSSQDEIKVDICSACHPFFTGEMRFVDVQGRVEKFQQKQKQAEVYKSKTKDKTKKATASKEAPKTLKEMLSEMKQSQQPTKEASQKQ